MVQNNKVLTVSYGTFSCTLEGFDDSFETMKAIAEYFRDLAADDRYFGSEPPQPDTRMLTSIAQGDRARRVEASQSESGLLLRAMDKTPQAASKPEDAMPDPFEPKATEFFAESDKTEPAAADSIAAKLQRIRAVVSHSNETPARFAEGEEDSAGIETPKKPKVDAISAAFEAGALNPADIETTEELQTEEQSDAPAAMAALTGFEAEVSEPLYLDPEAAAKPAEDEATFAEADVEELEVEQPEVVEQSEMPAELASDDVLFTDIEDTQHPATEDDEVQNILDDQDQETLEETVAEPTVAEEHPQDVLSAEDEANLLDEIAQVESELSSGPEEAETESTDREGDLTRLMDTADARMGDPETTDQRETYSHLRTAVAATAAERADDKGDAPAPDEEYRGDLASVVSPRRPEVQVTSSRPDTATPAPLKLVAEQRVDADDSTAAPVSPRRVQSKLEAIDEEGGFAQFAQDQGAQSLPDLLEAAAAYLSFIEGQEQFSRPQLMNKVRSLKQDDFNREESLRSFGQLLRDGKIEKAGGGRFAASNQIGFRPDDKRAVG